MRDPTQEAGGKAPILTTVSHNLQRWAAVAGVWVWRTWRRLDIRMHHIRRGGLIALAVGAAVVFFVTGAVLRLALGPISLGPLKGEISDSLGRTLPGIAVRFDDAALEWSREEGKLNLVILGARVFGADQRIIAQAPKAEIDLSAMAILRGEIEVKAITLVGVQLTLVHTASGGLRLGVERDKQQGDVLQRIRDAIANSKGGPSLDSFAVRHARMAFFDEASGAFIIAPDASLEVATGDGAEQVVSLDARIEVSGRPAHIAARVRLPSGDKPVSGDVSIRGINLKAVGENVRDLVALKPFDVAVDVTASFTVANGTHLRYADFGIGASGLVRGFGPLIDVKAIQITGRYDGDNGRLLIDDATLAGDMASAHVEGSGDLLHDAAGKVTGVRVVLMGDEIALNVPQQTSGTVKLAHLDIKADYDSAANALILTSFSTHGGALSAEMSGRITFDAEKSAGIDLDGTIQQIGVRDLLHYWPRSAADGARDWLDHSMPAGKLGPFSIRARIPVGAMDQPAMPDDALLVEFPVQDATAIYIKAMTPITQTRGHATLRGDSFEAVIDGGNVGPLKLSRGKVIINHLQEHGAIADTSAHADGTMTDLLLLIDQKPLGYPTRFHIDPKAMKGNAGVDLNFKIPTLKNLSVDDIGISVKAATTGFAFPLSPTAKIANGAVNFDVDNKALHAYGAADLNGTRVTMDWVETFKPTGLYSTRISVRGQMDDKARESLNFRVGEFVSGNTIVDARIDGVRGTIKRAQMVVDLTPTALNADILNFRKPAGVPATATITALFNAKNEIQSEEIVASGGGLNLRGTAIFSADGGIERLDVPTLTAGAGNDFAVTLSDTAAGFVLNLTGRSIDGTALGQRNPFQRAPDPDAKPLPAEARTQPFHITAKIDRVLMREGVTLSPLAFDVSGVGDRLQSLNLTGAIDRDAKIAGSLTTSDSGRKLVLSADNAGLLIQGMFGFKSIKEGQFELNVTLPPAGTRDPGAPDYTGTLSMRDFRIVDQPFVARMFTAGSLEGLVHLMRGDGVAIDKFTVPFKAKNNVFTIRDARASGPSIGVSAEGFVDRGHNQLGLRGVIAPLYGINSVLGAIPVLGDVLVSKQGEGVFGMTYQVNGNADEPKISMNPLSVLAPGIFRRIFEGSMPREAQTPPPPPPIPVPTPKGP